MKTLTTIIYMKNLEISLRAVTSSAVRIYPTSIEELLEYTPKVNQCAERM